MSEMCGTYKVWDLKGDVTGMVYIKLATITRKQVALKESLFQPQGLGF